MAEKGRKERFAWKAGDVEITLPNGKKLQPKKGTDTKKKSTKRGK